MGTCRQYVKRVKLLSDVALTSSELMKAEPHLMSHVWRKLNWLSILKVGHIPVKQYLLQLSQRSIIQPSWRLQVVVTMLIAPKWGMSGWLDSNDILLASKPHFTSILVVTSHEKQSSECKGHRHGKQLLSHDMTPKVLSNWGLYPDKRVYSSIVIFPLDPMQDVICSWLSCVVVWFPIHEIGNTS